MTPTPTPMGLTVAPLSYWWPRETLMHFYAELADGPADTLVLGEVTCSRRNDLSLEDWLALARDLRAAGKTVRLATLPLLMSEAELRTLRRIAEQGDFEVEAGDASALSVLARTRLAHPGYPGFTLGPHVNVYSRDALEEYAPLGARRWVLPAELSLEAAARIQPPGDPVSGPAGELRTEVFGFGRLPLAFSARCFTARHHHLHKDDCDFRCRNDADGLLLSSSEGQPFLVLNGTQTQSAALHCLIDAGAAVRRAGVDSLRLSPCSRHFPEVLRLFDAVFRHGADPAAARDALVALDLAGALVNGFAHGRAGLLALTP